MSWESAAKEWERLGRTDPYWAVISDDAYRAETFSGERLAAFLKTGEDDVDRMWRTCRLVFGADFAPRRALDFGCGVGRFALPLARRVANVVAADAADSMLSIARDVLARHGVGNVQLVKCDRELSGLDGPFDLVHSVLVLQHIPAGRGLWLTHGSWSSPAATARWCCTSCITTRTAVRHRSVSLIVFSIRFAAGSEAARDSDERVLAERGAENRSRCRRPASARRVDGPRRPSWRGAVLPMWAFFLTPLRST